MCTCAAVYCVLVALDATDKDDPRADGRCACVLCVWGRALVVSDHDYPRADVHV